LENKSFSAQGKIAQCVSRIADGNESQFGVHDVDRVFQRLELGRRETHPEWKVEWDFGEGEPRPVLHIRKNALVAYAEFCAPADLVATHWARIATAALAAGVQAGIATIIATPTAALPVFRDEFLKQLSGKSGGWESLGIALSAHLEPNGPWCECG
jgi:hypothetical protein